MDSKKSKLVEYLFYRYSDGSITKEEMDSLNSLILESEYARNKYFELLKTQIALTHSFQKNLLEDVNIFQEKTDQFLDSNTSVRGVNFSELNIDADTDDSNDPELTRAILEIAEMERTAPAVEINKPAQAEPERKLVQKVEREFKWFPGRPSKFQIRFLAAMAACILVIFGYLDFFVPDNIDRPVVAKLKDSIEAVWDSELESPDELGHMVQSKYGLKEGYASILFNDGAMVTVEAPAELSLNTSGDIELFSGRIYAIVPEKAHGFAVKAGSSKIVDLGTEFGVEVDNAWNTQLHVIKGKTMLIAGLVNGKKEQIEVNEGSSKKVYNDGFVKDLPLDKQKFARIINSKSNLVLRDDKFNLADVVGGGNGFGTGTLNKGIDMARARFRMVGIKNFSGIKMDDFSYKPFTEHPYIDGVCIPNGGAGPVKVSSRGDIFENCPQSAGLTGSGVLNGAFHYSGIKGIPKTQASLGGVTYGTVRHPAIYITPNQAVTFDLDAIRSDLGDVSISSFSSKAGLSEVLQKYSHSLSPKTSFYVLIDGVVRFKKIDQQATDEVLDIRVEINPNDRFLTIMTLQGTDGRTDYEWSLFAEPSLDLE